MPTVTPVSMASLAIGLRRDGLIREESPFSPNDSALFCRSAPVGSISSVDVPEQMTLGGEFQNYIG